MNGYQISFNVYANSQEEADKASEAFRTFVTEQAQQGRAVTAKKLSDAINKYKDNYFVNDYFR